MINLKVKTLDARTHEFSVDNEITVREFKDKILEKTNIPIAQQRIIYRGRVLGDDNLLKDLDVEGKVLHVAEQPPPPIREASPTTSSSGNEAQPEVINPFAPSSSFCMNRITVARHMLDCANNIAAYLEEPSRGLENVPLDILSRGRWTMESTVVEVGITHADLQQNNNILEMVQSAVQNALRRAGHNTNNVAVMQLPTVMADVSAARNSNPTDESVFTGPSSASVSLNDAAPAASPVTPRINVYDVSNSINDPDANFLHPNNVAYDSSNSNSTNEADDASNNESAAGSSNNASMRRTNTAVLADVIDQMRQVQARLEPFMQQYYELLRNEPTFNADDTEAQQNAQRLFDRVSEAIHYMAHAQHAISDLMLDVSLPTPRYLTCRPILVEQSGYVTSNNFLPSLTPNLPGNGPRQSTGQQTIARGALFEAMRTPMGTHFGPVQVRNAYGTPTHFQRRRHSASSSNNNNNRRTGSIVHAIDTFFNNLSQVQASPNRGTNQVAQPQQSQSQTQTQTQMQTQAGTNNLNASNRGNRTIIASTVDPNVFELTNQNIPAATSTTSSTSVNESQATPTTSSSSISTPALDTALGGLLNAINNSAQANNNIMPEVEVLPPIIVAVHDDVSHDSLNMSGNEDNNSDMHQIWGPVNIAPPDADLRVHIEPPRVIPMFNTPNSSTPSTTATPPNSGDGNSSNRMNATNTEDGPSNARRDVRFVTNGRNNRNPRSIPPVAFDRFLPCNSHHIDYIHANQQQGAVAGRRIYANPNVGMRSAATNTSVRNAMMTMPRMTHLGNYIPLLSQAAMRANLAQENEAEPSDSADTSGSSGEHMSEEFVTAEGSSSSEAPQTSRSNASSNVDMSLDVRVGNLRDQLQNFLRIHFFSFRGVNASTKSLALEKATEEFTRYLLFLPQYELPEYDSRASVINMFRAMFPELLDICFVEQAMPEFELALRSLTQKFCQRLYSVISVCVGGNNVELPWRQLMRGLQHQIYLGLGLEAVDFMCSYINSWLDWSVDANDIEQFLVKREQLQSTEIKQDNTSDTASASTKETTTPQPMETDEQESEKIQEDLDWRSLGIDFDENAANNASIRIEEDYVPEPPAVRCASDWHRNVPNSWVPLMARDEKLQESLAQEEKQEDRQPQGSTSRRSIPQEAYSDAYIAGMLAKRRKLLHMSKTPTDVLGLVTKCSRKAVVSLDTTTRARDMQASDNMVISLTQEPAFNGTFTQTIRDTIRERTRACEDYNELRFPNTAAFLNQSNQKVNGNAADSYPSTSSAVIASSSNPALAETDKKKEQADLSVESQQKKTN